MKRTTVKRITVKLLQELEVCEDQLELFKKFLGKRKCVYVTASNLKLAQEYGLNVECATAEGLVNLEAALTLPITAYTYAVYIDKFPKDDTRAAVLGDAKLATWYALHLDWRPRDDTRKAAYKDPHYRQLYIDSFGE